MSRAIGIDLGTTYTAVACVDEYGKPVVLKNTDGQTTTPSVVFFDPPNYVVGEVALQSTLTDPDRVVQFVKRFMGVKDHRIHVAGQSYSPEFVSSLILRKVVQEAQEELGETITQAVITVPAYFTEAQRHATYEAGQMAGLQVLRIINEPTAAALSYGVSHKGKPSRVLVYDLGGGTFDVTILCVENDNFDVISVGGDTNLGGKDFDDRLMNYVEEQTRAKLGEEIAWDEIVEAEVRFKCEAAKRALSNRKSTSISFKIKCGSAAGDDATPTQTMEPIRLEITRETFEQLCADMIERTHRVLERVLADADLIWSDIDDVLCVGGSSQMPMVQAMMQRVSGRKAHLYDVDECVAKGAAIQAAVLSQKAVDGLGETPQIVHVLPHALGVAIVKAGKTLIEPLVPALSPLPYRCERRGYSTVLEDQTATQVRIYEGDSRKVEDYVSPIGVFNLDMKPIRPVGRARINVEFRCDENGRVIVMARDQDTGREGRTILSVMGARSNEEAERERKLLAQASVS